MTITSADIKLIESERMLDTTDGGGRRTARVIPDGEAGNIFPKVSRLDATYGRVNLRKVYGTVDTSNVDTYAGAHAIITDPPDNNRINCCLFSTGSDFDARDAARDRIESYVVSGPESRMKLYGNQPVGARAMLAYQRVEEILPDIGDVYALAQESNAGETLRMQYIRVDTLVHEVRTFEDDKGTYQFRILTIGITSPISYPFSGPDTPPRLSSGIRLGKMRTATAADTARYFGTQPLATAVLAGDLTIHVPSVYTSIVPTTQREAAISLAEIGGALNYAAAGVPVSTTAQGLAANRNYFFHQPIKPGSVSISFTTFSGTVTDDGQGALSWPGVDYGGTVDYSTGMITTGPTVPPNGGNLVATATPAAPTGQPVHTRQIAVTLATRGALYSQVLSPAPGPGTLTVDYRALGKWYRLRDVGYVGTLAGTDPAYGTGTVDYVTGGVVITLGALPDVDSAVLLSWGSGVHYTVRSGATSDASPWLTQSIALAEFPVVGDVVVSYQLGNTFNSLVATKTLTISGTTATSNFSGIKLVGAIDRPSGVVTLSWQLGTSPDVTNPGSLPQAGSLISIAYGSAVADAGSPDPTTETLSIPIGAGVDSISAGKAIAPGSVRLTLPITGIENYSANGVEANAEYIGVVSFFDDGAGTLVGTANSPGVVLSRVGGGPSAEVHPQGVVFGTVDYATGAITIGGALPMRAFVWQPPLGLRLGNWITSILGTATRYHSTNPPTRAASLQFMPADAAAGPSAAHVEEFTYAQAPFRFDLTQTTGEPIVPGSVAFTLQNNAASNTHTRFFDRNGTIVRDPDQTTGVGTTYGTIDYVTGIVSLIQSPGISYLSSPVIRSCLTTFGEFVIDAATFRTSGSPVRPGSLYVQVTAEDGTQVSGTANTSGVITGTLIAGNVEQQMGVVSVRFGQWMPVAGNTGQPWYSADLVDPADSTRVWKPLRVIPSTLRYSAIVTSNVSLDTAILGLDPVRLPLDGRVPIYRPADVVVLHNTQSVTLTNPVSAGSTYTVGRTGLSDLWLVSAAGVRVDPNQYTVDLSAGSVTMASPLTLTGVPQPLIAKHRVEDMLLLADVQIDGSLAVAGPVSRNYATSGTYVSSALLFGDMSARVANIFDQQTWTGVWADAVTGDGATAQYNDVLFQVEVTNAGAITERWRLNFTSATTFQCIGQNSGVIATGSTGADFGPVNPLTLLPYFVIRSGGWGSGWSVGNQLRFNSISAAAPIWMARTVLPGAALSGDSIDVQLRGDVDA